MASKSVKKLAKDLGVSHEALLDSLIELDIPAFDHAADLFISDLDPL